MSAHLQSDPEILNLTLTAQDTEYSATLPEGTVAFAVQPRTDADVRMSYQPGRVANPATGKFWTVKGADFHAPYAERQLAGTNRERKLYFATGTAGTVVEILFWR